MADFFIGVEFGADANAVPTEGTSSTAARDVELRITYDATANSKQKALDAIDIIRARVVRQTWPPA